MQGLRAAAWAVSSACVGNGWQLIYRKTTNQFARQNARGCTGLTASRQDDVYAARDASDITQGQERHAVSRWLRSVNPGAGRMGDAVA